MASKKRKKKDVKLAGKTVVRVTGPSVRGPHRKGRKLQAWKFTGPGIEFFPK